MDDPRRLAGNLLNERVSDANMVKKRRGRSGTAVILFTVLACCLCACADEDEESQFSPQQQYEVTLERRSELAPLEESVVDAIGRSAWGEGLPSGKAGSAGCPYGEAGDFLYKRSRGTVPQTTPFAEEDARSAAMMSAKEHLTTLGMNVRVEPRDLDQYLYGEGSRQTVLIKFFSNGAAQMIVKTSCSSDWPDFTLTHSELAELEYRNSQQGEAS